MKTLRTWLNWICVLAMVLGLLGHPAPAASGSILGLHVLAASQPARQAGQTTGAAPAGLSETEWASVQAQIRATEYRAVPQQGGEGYQAFNRGQGFSAAFTPRGFNLTTSETGWTFGLELTAYGGLPLASDQGQVLRAEQARVTAARSPMLSEWYENTAQGLEHGLTLYAPPFPGSAALTLDFALSGGLQAEQISNTGLRLRSPSGAVALAYDGLAVYDASGRTLPASMVLLGRSPAGPQLRITVDASGALYPITVDPLVHSETIILYPSVEERAGFLEFGTAVALDGDTLVVGAWDFGGYMNNAPQGSGVEDAPVAQAGKVFVFQRNYGDLGLDPIPDAWGEVAVLQSSDAETSDYFGKAVAISGDTIAVGAPGEDGGMEGPYPQSGAVYLYQRNLGGEDMWGEVTTVYAPDAQLADQFGAALALDGNALVVGAPKRDDGSTEDSGAFYIFNRNLDGPDTWGFVTMQYQSDYWEQFGA